MTKHAGKIRVNLWGQSLIWDVTTLKIGLEEPVLNCEAGSFRNKQPMLSKKTTPSSFRSLSHTCPLHSSTYKSNFLL